MANELTVTLSLSGYKPSVMSQSKSLSVTGASFTMSGTFISDGSFLVATGSGTAIPLGAVTAPHYCVLHNLDAANYVTIRNGSGGTDVLKLQAGEWALFPFLDTATPWAVANTAAVNMEFLIFSL